jgi:hypothetical protein
LQTESSSPEDTSDVPHVYAEIIFAFSFHLFGGKSLLINASITLIQISLSNTVLSNTTTAATIVALGYSKLTDKNPQQKEYNQNAENLDH